MEPTGEYWRVTLATLLVEKIEQDINIIGVPDEFKRDCYWMEGSSSAYLVGYGWWPVVRMDQELDQYMKLAMDQEILIANQDTWQIEQRFAIVPWTQEEIDSYKKAQVQLFLYNSTNTIQQSLDEFAQSRNYLDCTTLCTYALGTDPVFSVEGLRMVTLRDQTWRTFFDYFAQVKSYAIPIPATLEPVGLPALTWE